MLRDKMKKTIILNIIFLTILIVFLELIINFFNLSQIMGIDSKIVLKNEENFSLKKNSNGKIFGEEVYTDKYGFRVPAKKYKYYKNKSSIFFIGDSTTLGNGIKENFTFVGKLRNKIEKFNFYNSSVFGYQIFHHSENLNMVEQFPNIIKIFYVFTLNDVFDVEKSNKNKINDKDLISKIKNINTLVKVNEFLRNKSHTYMLMKGLISDPSKRYFQYVNKYYEKKNEYNLEISYFSKLKKISNSKKMDLNIIILPYEFQTRVGNCNEKNLKPQKIIKKLLKSMNIVFIDYTQEFCRHKNPKSLFLKFDPMHLSEKGHHLVYELLSKKILE